MGITLVLHEGKPDLQIPPTGDLWFLHHGRSGIWEQLYGGAGLRAWADLPPKSVNREDLKVRT